MIRVENYWLFSIPVNFQISWGKILFSRHLIVKLISKDKEGIGEGVLYRTSGISAQKYIQLIIKIIQKDNSITNLQQKIQRYIDAAPGIVCAFDMALWDLKAKLNEKPLCHLLGKQKRKKIQITEQIFIKNEAAVFKEAEEIQKNKTHLKLKIGQNLNHDLKIIKKIKEKYPHIILQLDANQALDWRQLKKIDKDFQKHYVQALEEPAKKDYWPYFHQLSTLIILDESICSLESLKNAHHQKAIKILNLKLSRLGGITNSLKFIKFCQENNIKITLGCSEELGIGMAAILHLASTIKNLYAVEGLGSRRLDLDIIKEKFNFENGKIAVPQKIGLGVTFKLNQLKKNSITQKFLILEKKNQNLKFNLIELKNILKGKIINFFILQFANAARFRPGG